MRIPLRALVRAQNPRLRRITLRPIETTQSQADDLAAIYARTVRLWQDARPRIVEAYRQELSAARVGDGLVRDDTGWLRAVIEAVAGQVQVELTFFEALFQGWASRLVRWHVRRFAANLKYASNVDLSSALEVAGVDGTVADALARNVALVRNISDQARGRIADIVFRGLQQRIPADQVAREIAEATGMARDRARRAASDQTVKLSSALDRERMRQLGFKEFRWRHSGKVHYREWHKARDGKVFRLDDPALVGDMPGDQPFCGCVSQAYMEIANADQGA